MPVKVIEAIPQYSTAPDAPSRKLRACAYARISLDEDGNNGSIANQIAYFTDFLENNPDFCKTHVYYDDGISGTSTRNRHGFNQMMRDVEADMWDVIYTKSISRYSRNILVTLSSLKTCEDHNCRVFFQKESVWSDDPQTTLLLRILSSMAEAESSSLSGNVQMGIRYGFQQGKPMINCNHFLGYDKDPVSKKLVINPAEASIVRYIYRAFLEGFTPHEIAKHLREAHVPSGAGKSIWPVDTVRYILQNEKYVGDLLMQKTYCKSFLTHKMVRNEGKLPQYYVQDAHDPLIPREVWNLAQSELLRRGREAGHPGQRKYSLSGKVVCGCCGTQYKRFTNTRHAVSTTLPSTDDASTLPALPTTPLPAEPVNSIPAAPGDLEGGRAETSGEEGPENVEHTESRGEENSGAEVKRGGAVWKCMARCSRKAAASAFQRLSTSSASTSSGGHVIIPTAGGTPGSSAAGEDEHSEGQGGEVNPGSGEGNEAGGAAGSGPEPAAYRDGLTWRCDNKIIDEQRLQMAVDRALALLPREEANIRLIRDECLRVVADTPVATTAPSIPADGSGSSGDRRAAAQLLLLHIDTALSFLSESTSPQSAGSRSDALPCTTFQQFVERAKPTISAVENGSGGGSDAEAIDLLIERVVIGDDQIRVVFKAGVEI